MRNVLKVFLSLIVLVASNAGFTQNSDIEKLIQLTNSTFGNNDLLVNGTFYRRANVLADGHPYLFSDTFCAGEVIINGERFQNLPLLLDLEQNILVLKCEVDEVTRYLAMSAKAIDSVKYFGHLLISDALDTLIGFHGYAELIFDRGFRLIKVYDKRFIPVYNSLNPHGSFSKTGFKLFLEREEKVEEISTKRQLLRALYGYSGIRQMLKNEKIKYKKATNAELRMIMMFCKE